MKSTGKSYFLCFLTMTMIKTALRYVLYGDPAMAALRDIS
jgi:hypothetical protein